jgi:RNA polymerase sigma-70 factor, ECF subfamily
MVCRVGGPSRWEGRLMISRSRFEQLVFAHRNAAYNLAYWILQSPDDAEDAVQDAYVRAFRAFHTFAGNDPRPWLLSIVRNVAYTAFSARKQSRKVIRLIEDSNEEKSVDGAEAATQEPSPETAVIIQQEHKLLLQALAGLSPLQRDVLVLREMEGLSYKDIAEIMGTEIGTVMSRLSRARAELRRVLECTGNSRHPGATNRVGSLPD